MGEEYGSSKNNMPAFTFISRHIAVHKDILKNNYKTTIKN